MSSSAASDQPVSVPIQAARNVQPASIGHLLPLLMLLGSVTLPVLGKSFLLPLYLPFIYFGLLTRRIAISLRRVPRQDFYVALYCLAALCSAAYAVDLPKYAYGAFSLFLIAIPAYALGRRLGGSAVWSPKLFGGVLIGVSSVISALYLFQLATHPAGFRTAYLIMAPVIGGMHSIALVSFHVFGLTATLGALQRAKGLLRQLAFLGLVFLEVAGGLALNSKGYMLLMCIPLVGYFLAHRGRGAWFVRLVVVVAVVGIMMGPRQNVLSALTVRWNLYFSRVSSWKDHDRVLIWDRCIEVGMERPLFGHGLTNSFLGVGFMDRLLYSRRNIQPLLDLADERFLYRRDGYYLAHNTILQLFIEVGLFGMLIFMTIFARVLQSLGRLARGADRDTRVVARALLMSLSIAFTFGLLQNNFLTRDFGAFYWFLAGLICSLHRRQVAIEAGATEPTSISQPGAALAA